jgi:hypothetical protein
MPLAPPTSTTTSQQRQLQLLLQPLHHHPTPPIHQEHPQMSRNRDHQALNDTWRTCFAQQSDNDTLPIIATNLLPATNVPWGPDPHVHKDDKVFRIIFGDQNGFPRVNDTLPSWTSTMDFLCGLNTSSFAFTEPNLQWDRTLVQEAKNTQRNFFAHGQLVASESEL